MGRARGVGLDLDVCTSTSVCAGPCRRPSPERFFFCGGDACVEFNPRSPTTKRLHLESQGFVSSFTDAWPDVSAISSTADELSSTVLNDHSDSSFAESIARLWRMT